VTVSLSRRFARGFLAEASYTASRLYGNYSGLYRPETVQLNPSNTSDFDLAQLLVNKVGALPLDRTHNIKIFAAKDVRLSNSAGFTLGGAYRAASGTPINYLGADPIYGLDEVFILPRGAGGRTPWVHSLDAHLGFTFKITRTETLTVAMEVFNLVNSQQVTRVNERYTSDTVLPVQNGTREDLANLPVTPDPDHGTPRAYQSPRSFRFGARITF